MDANLQKPPKKQNKIYHRNYYSVVGYFRRQINGRPVVTKSLSSNLCIVSSKQ